MRMHRGRWCPLLFLTLVLPLSACASASGRSGGGAGAKPAGKPAPKANVVDLAPARAAVEEARRAGAPQRAAATFRQAEAHLKEAEALNAVGALTTEKAQVVELLGKLATSEAWNAAGLSLLYPRGAAGDKTARGDESDLAARARRAMEERRRLEDRVGLLQRELELTETEVVRTKARLQGIETKAEASSAIAEARILVGRVDARDRPTLSRCQELLTKAEEQIQDNNYGAAVFFARKAADIAAKAREPASSPQP
ncbi:MAG: hypothetical protein ACHQKZ_02770 [Solirubrobacterales bacterium]